MSTGMRANGPPAFAAPPPFPHQQQQQQLPPSGSPAVTPAQTAPPAGPAASSGGHMYNPYAQPFMPAAHLHGHLPPPQHHNQPRYWNPAPYPPPHIHPLAHLPPPPPHVLPYAQHRPVQKYHFNQHNQPQHPLHHIQPIQHHLIHQPPAQLPIPIQQQQLQPPLQQQYEPEPVLEQPHTPVAHEPEATPSLPADEQPVTQLFVISRYKYEPVDAPGLTFSPHARPPQDVIDRASKDFPPAPRPAPKPRRQPRFPTPRASQPQPDASTDDQPAASDATPSQTASRPQSPAPAPALAQGDTSVAETTPATSVAAETLTPHSPISTNTSLSISPKVVSGTPSATSAPLPAVIAHASVEPVSKLPDTPTPTAAAAGPVTSSTEPTKAAAAAPKPAPIKKSWAELLRPGPGASAGALPTSSVVGVSVSAEVERVSNIFASPAKRAAVQAVLQLLSTPLPPNTNLPPLRPRGLINGGNLCFANTILQALVYSPPFYRLFSELGKQAALAPPTASTSSNAASGSSTPQRQRTIVGSRLGGPSTPLVDATVTFLDEFAPAQPSNDAQSSKTTDRSRSPTAGFDSDAFVPTYIYDALKEKKRFDSMRRGHQEDAEEFLGFYLDTLEEELLAILGELSPAASGSGSKTPVAKSETVVEESMSDAGVEEDGWTEVGKRNRGVVITSIKTVESPITRIFGGKFRSVLRTPGSGKDSVLIQDWNRLQLDIQPPHVVTIPDALRQLTVAETVHVGPSSSTEASKQVQLDTLPNVLVLHLKRFAYDPTLPGGGGVVKNGKHVKFEPVLEFSNELMAPGRKNTTLPKYRLFAIIYHHGQSATGGHYTLDILHPAAGHQHEPWLRVDDDLVKRVRPETVFEHDGRDDKVAYLLLYRPIR